MVWQKGDPWRVVKALDRLNVQIRAACPRAVPPATPASSWGSIADSAHDPTSDHYPHYYGALGSIAVVCARDFPHAPALGLDAHAIAERIRLSRDTRVGYVISNRRITGPNHGWRWDPYSGSDPHDTHIHVSSVHTASADNTRDWQIGGDMFETPDRTSLQHTEVMVGQMFTEVRGTLAGLRAAVGAIAAEVNIDPVELAAVADAARQASEAGTAAALAESVDDWADRIAAKVPSASRDELVAAVREVFADAGAAGA